jgi:hypothetical protein
MLGGNPTTLAGLAKQREVNVVRLAVLNQSNLPETQGI